MTTKQLVLRDRHEYGRVICIAFAKGRVTRLDHRVTSRLYRGAEFDRRQDQTLGDESIIGYGNEHLYMADVAKIFI